jgi:hypothetical protein
VCVARLSVVWEGSVCVSGRRQLASHGKAKSDVLDQYGIDEEFVFILAPGKGSQA